MKFTKIFLFTLLAIFSLSFIANTTNVAQATSPVEGKVTVTVTDPTPPTTYVISTSIGANGNVSPTTKTVNYGDSASFTITPNTDYTASASGCGGSLSGTNYTTGVITADCTVTASFTQKSISVTLSDFTAITPNTTNPLIAGVSSFSFAYTQPTTNSPLGFVRCRIEDYAKQPTTLISGILGYWAISTSLPIITYGGSSSLPSSPGSYGYYIHCRVDGYETVDKYSNEIIVNINDNPVVNAGADKSINLPTNSVSLVGTVTDTYATPSTVKWTKVSGPNTPTIATPTALTTNITGLVEGTYVFRLKATDALDLKGTDDVTVTVYPPALTAPPTPTSPSATISSTSCGSGTISWTASTGATTYVIYRSTNNISYTPLTPNVSAPTVSKTDSGLTAGQKYYYKIAAANGSGESAATAAVSYTVPTACAGPTAASWSGYGACYNGSKSGYCTEQTGGHATTCASLGYSAGTNTTTTGCLPNLTVSASSPATAKINVAQNYTATITNSNAAMGKTSNYFFQVASSLNGGGTISNKTASTLSDLAAGETAQATLNNIKFDTVGTYSMRVCADKTSPSDAGVITESNEDDNCGSWTNVVVTSAGAVPTLDTANATNKTPTGATLGARLKSFGIPNSISARGVCYQTFAFGDGKGFPSKTNINSTCTPEGNTILGSFTVDITGLLSSTNYIFIGYATNATGTGYSGTGMFKTLVASVLPNLTVSASSPTTATVDVAQNYTATITNSNAAMGKTSNYFFQVASSLNGGGTISNKTASTLSDLAAGETAQATLNNIKFDTVGTYSMRVCADKTSPSDAGVITESNEDDNCGSWTNITVDVATPQNPSTIANCTVVSDTTNIVSSGANAVATWAGHPEWTAYTPGATWIWRTYLVENPGIQETETFTKTFYLDSTNTITDAQIVVNADNTETVWINDIKIIEEWSQFNPYEKNKKTVDVKPYLKKGTNTLKFLVTNFKQVVNITPYVNPAGLLYKLSITDPSGKNDNCNTFTPPDPSLPLPIITSFNIKSNGTSALSPNTIRYNTRVNIAWTSTDATSCACTSADTKGIPGLTCGDTFNNDPGSFQTLSLKKSMIFTLSCLNGDGVSTSESKTVTVDDINTIYKEN